MPGPDDADGAFLFQQVPAIITVPFGVYLGQVGVGNAVEPVTVEEWRDEGEVAEPSSSDVAVLAEREVELIGIGERRVFDERGLGQAGPRVEVVGHEPLGAWQPVRADEAVDRRVPGDHLARQRQMGRRQHDAELRQSLLPRVEEGDYEELPTAAVFRALKELEAQGRPVDFSTLGALTEGDPLASDIVPLVLMHEPERAEGEATDQFVAEAESCLMTLRLMSYDRRLKELAAEIAQADRAGDDALRDRLVMESLELNRRRTALLPHAGSVTPGGPSY